MPSLASNADAKERFLREGEAASRIRHPHVVDVTDLGSEGAVIYLVMEYLEGEDLSRLLARQGFLSPGHAADIMLPVTAAIATAHEQGVIHRDLKPENIFLARSAYGAVHPKVLDFGISKVLGDSRARALTGTAATMGTMHYLPPEQLRAAREADARSDQYGLGTILYECLTGQRAFEEDSFYLLLKKIAEGEFDRPSLRRSGLPERLEAIVLRAMSLDPLGRFDSVKQLGAALLEFSSEGTRMLWAPFFGTPPAIDVPTSGSPLSNAPTLSGDARSSGSPASRPPSERPRVATLVAPSTAPSGATMELPQPAHNRKASSTTLRNATGERAMPTRPGRPGAGARRRLSGASRWSRRFRCSPYPARGRRRRAPRGRRIDERGDVVLDGVASGDRGARRAEARASDCAAARSEAAIDGAATATAIEPTKPVPPATRPVGTAMPMSRPVVEPRRPRSPVRERRTRGTRAGRAASPKRADRRRAARRRRTRHRQRQQLRRPTVSKRAPTSRRSFRRTQHHRSPAEISTE